MRQFNILRGTKGLLKASENHIRFKYMITKEAQKRMKILTFWSEHGLKAAKDAFGVSKPTLYRWKKGFNPRILESLNPGSRKPKRFRQGKLRVQFGIETFVINLRQQYPRLGKEKIKPLLDEYCNHNRLRNLSISSIGLLLRSLKDRQLLADGKTLRVRPGTGRIYSINRKYKSKQRLAKGFKSNTPGELIQIDTVIQFINGIRRYCVTAVDTNSRFAFAYGYSSVSSKTAADFLTKLLEVAPFRLQSIQTDNGSEFAKYFQEALARQHISHFHTYPRTPKSNAFIERFNRSIQYEFANFKRDLWSTNLDQFNRCLMDWLIWYNTKRVHKGIGLQTPINYLLKVMPESHMYVTRTSFCNCRNFML